MLGRFGKLGNITPAYRASGGGGKTYRLFDAWDFSTKNNDSPNPEQMVGEKGHILNLRNFAFAGSSGYGLYPVIFGVGKTWEKTGYYSSDDVTFTNTSITLFKATNQSAIIYTYITDENGKVINNLQVPSFKMRITGLGSGEVIRYQYIATADATELTRKNFVDGESVVPMSFAPSDNFSVTNSWVGFICLFNRESTNITIEVIPDYEGALVFDNVDDLAAISFADTIGVGEDFTILADYQPLGSTSTVQCFIGCRYGDLETNLGKYVRFFYPANVTGVNFFRGVRGYCYPYETNDPKVYKEMYKSDTLGRVMNVGMENYRFKYLFLNGAMNDDISNVWALKPVRLAFYKVVLYKGVMTQEEMDEEIAKQFPGSKSVRALTSDDVEEYVPSDNLSDYQKYIVIPMDELYSKDDNWAIRITNVARTEAVVHLEEYDRWYPPIYRTVSEGEQERVYIHPVITGRELKDLLETPEWKSDVEAI
jgi:hypothetical protein